MVLVDNESYLNNVIIEKNLIIEQYWKRGINFIP